MANMRAASSKTVKMVAAIATLFVLLMVFKMEARAAVMQTTPAASIDGIVDEVVIIPEPVIGVQLMSHSDTYTNVEIVEIPEVINEVPLAACPGTHKGEVIEIIPETVVGDIPEYITVNLDNANGYRYGLDSKGLLFITDSNGRLLAAEDESEDSGIVVYIVKNGVRTSAVHDDGTLIHVRIVL